MKIWEILEEAVGGQYLYHGVPDGQTMNRILKSGEIKPMPVFDFDRDQETDDPDAEVPDRISLTRNQYLHFPYGNGVAQIVVDRDALKQRGYKIKLAVGAMIGHKDETEERVFKPIPLKAPFVVSIQYDPELKVPKSFIDRVKAAGIKIEPWRKSRSQDQEQEPDYDLNFNYSDLDPKSLAAKIRDILDKGIDPLPDWRELDLKTDVTGSSIYYKIPGWTDGINIQPFGMLNDEDFAKRIFAQLQQLTKAGKSIRPVMNKYAQRQFGKDWKQGRHQIRPGDPGYKNPDEDKID
jgi:hypothetical protein